MRWVLAVLGFVLLVDGGITAVRSREFLEWQRRVAPARYRPVLDALLRMPSRLVQAGAVVEALLGLWLLSRALRSS